MQGYICVFIFILLVAIWINWFGQKGSIEPKSKENLDFKPYSDKIFELINQRFNQPLKMNLKLNQTADQAAKWMIANNSLSDFKGLEILMKDHKSQGLISQISFYVNMTEEYLKYQDFEIENKIYNSSLQVKTFFIEPTPEEFGQKFIQIIDQDQLISAIHQFTDIGISVHLQKKSHFYVVLYFMKEIQTEKQEEI